jgi:hypothetical protein
MNRTCLLAFLLAGCVADTGDEGFVVRNNLAPDEEKCSFVAATSSPALSRGTLHTRSSSAYLLTPLIESRLTAAMGQEQLRTVSLQGAKVDLAIGPITVEDALGAITFSCAAEGDRACFSETERDKLADDGLTKFRQPFSAPLPPNGGLSSAVFDLVPTTVVSEIKRKVGAVPVGGRMNALVLATATVYGQLGGSEVNGLPFMYPVTVCDDCIVNNLGPCGEVSVTFEPRTGNPCNAYQDGVIDCCTNAAGGAVCPAVGTKP